MNPATTHIILGPPGTGKTTTLMGIVERLVGAGNKLNEIAFITFTKKGADVAVRRASEKFNVAPFDIPYFRTCHSLAFLGLGMEKSQVMNYGNYLQIAQSLGVSVSFKSQSEDGTFAGFEKGDRMLFMDGMARARMVPLKEVYDEANDENFQFIEVEQMSIAIDNYKRANDKRDFTDMIIEYTKQGKAPPVKYLIVDEAQDMSACQWAMVRMLASHCQQTWIAGDDDQAIFRWAGADVDALIKAQGIVTILGQSYRVPQVIAKLADDIVKKIHDRREKEWKPRSEQGEILYVHGIDQIDMGQGTWLCLARNGHLLKRFESYCTIQGYLFTSPNLALMRGPSWDAVRSYERMRAGKSIPIGEAVNVYDFMNVRERVTFGFKGKLTKLAKDRPETMITLTELRASFGLRTEAIWHEALDRLAEEDREYFLAALRRGEKVNQEPRIKISTIHGAKGGEAENVVLIPEMARRTYDEFNLNPDDEHRVWYVAVTRALRRLYIIQPTNNLYYDL